MPRFATLLRALAAGLLIAAQPVAAIGQLALPGSAPSAKAKPSPASASAIGADSDAAQDGRIVARLRGIYAEIAALRPVQVRASAGVVTLSGTVADAKAKAQAQTIAERLDGVVTVQNQLRRNVGVGQTLPLLAGLKAKLAGVVDALPLIGVAILLAAAVGFIGHLIAARKRLWRRVAPNPFLAELLASSIRFVFIVAGIVVALDMLGASAILGAVLGSAGVVGLAIGFAVKDTIDNYVSSLMLSVRQPFRAKDHVIIDTHEGRVVRLTSRATVLMTLDGNHLRLPNSMVFKAVITNFTTNPQRRFTFEIPIDHSSDPCAARHAGVAAISELEYVLDDPPVRAEVMEMPETYQILRFAGWVDQSRADFKKVRTRAYEAARAAIRGAGTIIPDATMNVRMLSEGAQPPPPAPPPAPEQPDPGDDVAPERHIEDMVSQERATDAGTEDLLDSTRPTE